MTPAFTKLFLAEIEYLRNSGWTQKNVGAVIEPPQSVNDIAWGHPNKRGLTFSHENAIRSQKEIDLNLND